MKGHLSSPDNQVRREVESRLWAKERRNAVSLCIGTIVLLVVAYLTPWKWQISLIAFGLGLAALLQTIKEPNLTIKVPPLLLMGLSIWLFWASFSVNQITSLSPLLSRLPFLQRSAKQFSPTHSTPAKASTVGYLQGTSRKPIATIYYRGRKKSGKADCSPYSKVIALPPGHYRVRIEGVPRSSVARERDVLIRPGRLTSVGPDK